MQLKATILLASVFTGMAIANPLPDAGPVAVAEAEPAADATADPTISTAEVDSPLVSVCILCFGNNT